MPGAPSELLLRLPIASDEPAFRAAVHSFELSEPGWDFAFLFDGVTDFSKYVERVRAWTHGKDLPERFVLNTYLLAFVDGTLVGRVSIRHRLNDFLARVGGHIGYGVVPEHRRKGYGTKILAQALPVARKVSIEHALVTCDGDNEASAKIIEANGGVLDAIVTEAGLVVPKRRYCITLG